MNYINYLKENGTKTFDELPLTEVDIAIINELGYLPFEQGDGLDLDFSQPIILSQIYQEHRQKIEAIVPDFLATKARLELLLEVCQAKRFITLSLSHYTNDISHEYEKQFAAMVFSLPEIHHQQIVYRGTDDSIIGWKEDFQMTYMREIPAQRSAKAYLQMVLPSLSGKVILSGHSKGGNLAVYAGASISHDLQDKISLIYMLDAPGLHKEVLSSPSYKAIRSKIIALRPKESLVGILMESDVECKIIESQARGISQHAVETWEIEGDAFQTVEQATEMSLICEKIFKEWNQTLTRQELKLLVDTVFDFFLDAGVDSLNDFLQDGRTTFSKLLSANSNLDPKRREVLVRSANLLLTLYAREWQEKIRQDRPAFNLPITFPRFPLLRQEKDIDESQSESEKKSDS